MAFDKTQEVLRNLTSDQVLNRLGAFLDFIIIRRIERGQYLNSPGANVNTRATRPYNKKYAAKRQAKGFQVATVDMKITGITRDNMDHRIGRDVDGPFIEYGYLSTAEPRARKIAGYHNITGAGESRVLRPWVGLTQEETHEAIAEARRLALSNLK